MITRYGQHTPPSRPRILLVEDTPDELFTLLSVVESNMKCHVVALNDPGAALSAILGQGYDVVVTDYSFGGDESYFNPTDAEITASLGRLTGVQLIDAAMKQLSEGISPPEWILLTGRDIQAYLPDDERRLLKKHYVTLLDKSITAEKLIETIQKAARRAVRAD